MAPKSWMDETLDVEKLTVLAGYVLKELNIFTFRQWASIPERSIAPKVLYGEKIVRELDFEFISQYARHAGGLRDDAQDLPDVLDLVDQMAMQVLPLIFDKSALAKDNAKRAYEVAGAMLHARRARQDLRT